MPVSVDVPARVDLRAHVAHWRGGLAGQFGLAGLAIFGTAREGHVSPIGVVRAEE